MAGSFFKKPTLNIEKNNSFASKARELFLSLLFLYSFVISTGFILKCIDLIIVHYTDVSIYKTVITLQENMPSKYSWFVLVLIAPIIEETVFRLPLVPSRRNLIIALAMLSASVVVPNLYHGSIFDTDFLMKTGLIAMIHICLFYLLKDSKLEKLNARYFPIYFYALSLCFGLVHITNFISAIPKNFILLAPLFILPQFFLGVFAGYIRIKNGFLWGLAMHCIFNLPATLMYLSKH